MHVQTRWLKILSLTLTVAILLAALPLGRACRASPNPANVESSSAIFPPMREI